MSEHIAYIVLPTGNQCIGHKTHRDDRYVSIDNFNYFSNAFNKTICEMLSCEAQSEKPGTIIVKKFTPRPKEEVTLKIFVENANAAGINLVVHQTTRVGTRILFVCVDHHPAPSGVISPSIMGKDAIEAIMREGIVHMKIDTNGLRWHLD